MTTSARRSADSRTWRRDFGFSRGCGYEEGCAVLLPVLADLDAFLADVPGLGRKRAADIRLVCDELGANVLRHGCVGKNVAVEVEVWADGDRVLLRFRDDGPAFDPYSQADPYVGPDVEKRPIGGLGLYFIRQLFPAGRYERKDGWNMCEVECLLDDESAS